MFTFLISLYIFYFLYPLICLILNVLPFNSQFQFITNLLQYYYSMNFMIFLNKLHSPQTNFNSIHHFFIYKIVHFQILLHFIKNLNYMNDFYLKFKYFYLLKFLRNYRSLYLKYFIIIYH